MRINLKKETLAEVAIMANIEDVTVSFLLEKMILTGNWLFSGAVR